MLLFIIFNIRQVCMITYIHFCFHILLQLCGYIYRNKAPVTVVNSSFNVILNITKCELLPPLLYLQHKQNMYKEIEMDRITANLITLCQYNIYMYLNM